MKSKTNKQDEKVCPKCGDSLMTYFPVTDVWCCPKCDIIITGKEATI